MFSWVPSHTNAEHTSFKGSLGLTHHIVKVRFSGPPKAVFSWVPSRANAKHTSVTLDTSCCEGKISLVPKAVLSSVPSQTHNFSEKVEFFQASGSKGAQCVLTLQESVWEMASPEIQWERTSEYFIWGGPLNKVFGSWSSWISLCFKGILPIEKELGTQLIHQNFGPWDLYKNMFRGQI